MTCLIVGAGIAGAQAATSMRQAGFEGRIVLIGEEPDAPYERPPLSKFYLTNDAEAKVIPCFEAAHYEEQGIELMLGVKVERIDTQAQQVSFESGPTLSYDRLVIATGSRARKLQVPGADHVFTLRNAEDAARLRHTLEPGKKVVCIGAGVIGLEVAASARSLGCDVTILEYGDTLMGRSLPKELAGVVERIHRSKGVEFRFGAAVTRIDEGRVHCASGDAFDADIIIAGIGAERNTEIAAASGIAVQTGILVDEHGRTNIGNIFCAGEVAEYYSPENQKHLLCENWQHGQRHGAFVGKRAAGKDAVFDEIPRFWTDQYDTSIQVAGSLQPDAQIVYRGDPQSKSFSAFLLDARSIPIGVISFNSGKDVAAGSRLIAAAKPVDREQVADISVPLKRLLARTSQ